MPRNQAIPTDPAADDSTLFLSSDISTPSRPQVESHYGPTLASTARAMLSPEGLVLSSPKPLAANRAAAQQRAKWITDKLLARTHQTFTTNQREPGTTDFNTFVGCNRDLVKGWSALLITKL